MLLNVEILYFFWFCEFINDNLIILDYCTQKQVKYTTKRLQNCKKTSKTSI